MVREGFGLESSVKIELGLNKYFSSLCHRTCTETPVKGSGTLERESGTQSLTSLVFKSSREPLVGMAEGTMPPESEGLGFYPGSSGS